MRKMVLPAAIALLMAILTAVYIGMIVYSNANSSHGVDANGYGKDPIKYGIWKHYLAKKLETEPEEWYTPEELGIMLVESEVIEGRYHIYIVDEQKALPWMNGTMPMPYAVKYENNFYRITFLWVTPGLPETVKSWLIPTGIAIGGGWVFIGALFIKWWKNR